MTTTFPTPFLSDACDDRRCDVPRRCDCDVCAQDRRLLIVKLREVREAQKDRRRRRLATKEKYDRQRLGA